MVVNIFTHMHTYNSHNSRATPHLSMPGIPRSQPLANLTLITLVLTLFYHILQMHECACLGARVYGFVYVCMHVNALSVRACVRACMSVCLSRVLPHC